MSNLKTLAAQAAKPRTRTVITRKEVSREKVTVEGMSLDRALALVTLKAAHRAGQHLAAVAAGLPENASEADAVRLWQEGDVDAAVSLLSAEVEDGKRTKLRALITDGLLGHALANEATKGDLKQAATTAVTLKSQAAEQARERLAKARLIRKAG